MAKLTTQLSLGPRISARRARELMLEQAQDLIYKAWETSSRKRRIALAEKALTNLFRLRRCVCPAGRRC